MSAADLKPGVARLRFGSRNEALEAALTDLLKRNLVTIDLKFDPPGALKWVELRRPRDEAVLARMVIRDEAREELLDLHADFVEALGREGLALREGGALDLPVGGSEAALGGVLSALESSASRPPTQPTSGQEPRKTTAWDILEDMIGSVDAPPDWASEHDHYLYGTPKRGEK